MAKKMKKRCDHKNVGVLIYNKSGKLLLVNRKKRPHGWSLPAIHVDQDGENFRAAARRAVLEKVGLTAEKFVLLLKRTCENKCRRRGGGWHNLRVFKASKWRGKLQRSKTETKDARWFSQSAIRALAEQNNPGLEMVWRKIFKNLGII